MVTDPMEFARIIQIMKKSTEDKASPGVKPGDLVLFRTNSFWICNKPAGMPTVPDKTGDKSLLDMVEIYGKRRFFPVHRLDRPVSGIVLFARTAQAAAALSGAFANRQVHKVYLAITEQIPEPPCGLARHFLRHDTRQSKSLLIELPQDDAKVAVLQYDYITSSKNYHLLKIKPEGGHFHQIRAQLAAMNCPIKGDVKYGARRSNPDKSIHLHAWTITFPHPVTDHPVYISCPIPKETLWQVFADHLTGLETEQAPSGDV